MATAKSMKIQAEIDKVKAKISEQQARLKELEQKKLEAENSEIVDIVRGMSIPLDQLPLLFEKLKGGALGQSVPKLEPAATEEPAEPTVTPGEGFSEEGNLVTRDLLYDEHTNKQFITVQARGGATFYLVIDYDKPVDEEGEQYETYFLNMVDEADLLAAAEAAGAEAAVCSCAEKCAAGAVNTDCPVCSVNMGKCVGAEPEPVADPVEEPEPEPEKKGNAGMLLIILALAVIGGGAGWYFKICRPKQEKAAGPEEDYGDELEDYDGGDDMPPWDEDEPEEMEDEE